MPEDKTLTCRSCGRAFLFTAAEQAFYAEKGLASQPRRCKECRRAQQARRARQTLYKGICAACGREAQVPFCPEETRLIYCRDCYSQMQAERRANRSHRGRRP